MLMLFTAPIALADSSPATDYKQAVEQAYGLIKDATGDDAGPAVRAVSVLKSGIDGTQPEIIGDLERRPPDYEDARARLLALLAGLDQPATTSDPALTQQRLQQVLSMSRYSALHQPPSPLDRFVQWVKDRITALFRLLPAGRGGAPAPDWFFFAVGAIAVAAVALVVFRSTRGRFNQAIIAATPSGPHSPADYFVEADRLAAAGDRVGAIRALCAGVAGTLAGERTWEGSPLTVREIFARSPDFARLRPLLLPFEAAVYGGRDVDQETYEGAAQVAAHFRRPAQEAA